MSVPLPEKDWKYLKSVQTELLSSLCERINSKALEILGSDESSQNEKYKVMYRHVLNSEKIVAECFDDWRRSNIWLKLIELKYHNLLTEEHIIHLSNETKDRIKNVMA